MPQSTTEDRTPGAGSTVRARGSRWIRIVAGITVPWNLIGVGMFLSEMGLLGTRTPPPGGAEMPALVMLAFGIGTVTGLLGSVGLTMLRRWSRPVLWLSAVALVIDWIWVLGFSGAGSFAIGGVVLLVAAALVVLAEIAQKRSLLV